MFAKPPPASSPFSPAHWSIVDAAARTAAAAGATAAAITPADTLLPPHSCETSTAAGVN